MLDDDLKPRPPEGNPQTPVAPVPEGDSQPPVKPVPVWQPQPLEAHVPEEQPQTSQNTKSLIPSLISPVGKLKLIGYWQHLVTIFMFYYGAAWVARCAMAYSMEVSNSRVVPRNIALELIFGGTLCYFLTVLVAKRFQDLGLPGWWGLIITLMFTSFLSFFTPITVFVMLGMLLVLGVIPGKKTEEAAPGVSSKD